MKTVTVVMSSYNGENRIIPQLDSIFAQKGVEVRCYVRDDGSKDGTLNILRQYRKSQPNLYIESGQNLGWQKSFLVALKNAPKSDYYAFSDQDDIWFENKLISGVNELEKHDQSKALLYHCNKISCDEHLTPYKHQTKKIPKPLSLENATVQEYVQGCSAIINERARSLVCRCLPKGQVPHDFWTGLICYYFGEVCFSNKPYFYHINHGNNASTDGHIRKGQFLRLKNFMKGNIYPNVAGDLLRYYPELIEDENFFIRLRDYKRKLSYRLYLLFNPRFRRVSWEGTLMLKMAVIFGKIE